MWPAAAPALLDTLTRTAPAGLLVTGDLDLLAWHSANADVLAALTLGQTAAALLVRRRLGGPLWPIGTSALPAVLVGAQQALGEARMLAGHLPLGRRSSDWPPPWSAGPGPSPPPRPTHAWSRRR